jgi:maleylpyruvate isomerase
MSIQLYSYFRSSASYRVRIALHLKGLAYDTLPVHLLRHGGEQFSPVFRDINPQSQVPVMLVDGEALTQSLALLEYLEERFPQPPLLPVDMLARAHVREIALAIACDIHPLNNLRVLRMLKESLASDDQMRHDEIKQQWITHWIQSGFAALETRLANSSWRGQYCYADTPTMADCCLVPQMFNARRFAVD